MKKVSIFLSILVLLLLVSCGGMPKSLQLSDVTKTAYVDGVLLEWSSDSSANQYKITYEGLSTFVSESKVFVPLKPDLFGTLGNVEITPYSKSGAGDPLTVSVLSESFDYYAVKPELVDKTPTTVTFKYEPLNVYVAKYKFNVISQYEKNFGSGAYGETSFVSKSLTPYLDYKLNITEVEFSYKDLGGNDTTASTQGGIFDFTTGSLPAVKNVKVEDITKTGFKVTFSKYEASDLEGIENSTYNIAYCLYVKDSEGEEVYKSSLLNHDGNDAPEFIVTELEGNKEYKFIVLPVWDEYFYDKSPAPEAFTSVKTKVPLKMPVFEAINIQETGKPSLEKPYTSVEIVFSQSEDDKDGKFLYDVGYYVIKSNGAKKYFDVDETTNIPNAKTFSEINGKITISNMNAGNTYKFILYMYNPDDNYSEDCTKPVSMKLTTFNDNKGGFSHAYDYKMQPVDVPKILSTDSKYKIDFEKLIGSPTTARICLDSTVMESEKFAKFYVMGAGYKSSETVNYETVSLAFIDKIDTVTPATSYTKPIFSVCKEAGLDCAIKPPKDTYLLNANTIYDSDIFNDSIYITVWPKYSISDEYIGYSLYCK